MSQHIKTMYDSLKTEYTKAEDELKNVDKNLKKLIGSNSFDIKSSISRSKNDTTGRRSGRNHFDDNRYSRSGEMNRKRRLSDSNSKIFSRLDKRLDDDKSRSIKRPSLQSTIVTTQTMAQVKQEKQENVLHQDKGPDKKSEVRNRRMFGMIMGTLQKFQNEESQRKVVTTKREEIEKKLDQADAQEKEAVKKEKLSLIESKKVKQTQLRDIEVKMDRVEIHQQWEKSNQHLTNFIQTKAKPHIFYMPKKLTPETEKRLKESKNKMLIILAERRAKIQKEIDDLNKREEELKKENNLSFEEIKNEAPDTLEDASHLKNGLKMNEKLSDKINNEEMNENDLEDGECKDEKLNELNKEDNSNENSKDNLKDNESIIDNRQEEIDSQKQSSQSNKFKDDRSNESKEDNSNESKEDRSNESKDDRPIESKENQLNESKDDQTNVPKEHQTNEPKEDQTSQQVPTTEKIEDKEFEPIYDE